ncbi:hypothetical protein [Aquimarina sp. 2304DJ70-9]|uniref:hypothetical protein n=1 Tax=Aquimarina penaris TaxID=3231044 RepID=UPI0034619769
MKNIFKTLLCLALLLQIRLGFGQSSSNTVGIHSEEEIRTSNLTIYNTKPKNIFNALVFDGALSPGFETRIWDHSKSDKRGEFGVGSVMTCTFKQPVVLVQRIVAVNYPNFIIIEVDTEKTTVPFPVKNFEVVHFFKKDSGGKTLHIMNSYFDFDNAKPFPGGEIGFEKFFTIQMNAGVDFGIANLGGEVLLKGNPEAYPVDVSLPGPPSN